MWRRCWDAVEADEGLFTINFTLFSNHLSLRDIFPTKGKTLKISQMDLRKMQWNCVLIKVLLNFFQKIFRVWGETPRSFSLIKFCICFLYYFDTIFPIWKNHSLLYCDFLFFNIYEYSKKYTYYVSGIIQTVGLMYTTFVILTVK